MLIIEILISYILIQHTKKKQIIKANLSCPAVV